MSLVDMSSFAPSQPSYEELQNACAELHYKCNSLQQEATQHIAGLNEQIASLNEENDKLKDAVKEGRGRFNHCKGLLRQYRLDQSSLKQELLELKGPSGQNTNAAATIAIASQLKEAKTENEFLDNEVKELQMENMEQDLVVKELEVENMEQELLVFTLQNHLQQQRQQMEEESGPETPTPVSPYSAKLRVAHLQLRKAKRAAHKMKREGQTDLRADFRAAIASDYATKLAAEKSRLQTNLAEKLAKAEDQLYYQVLAEHYQPPAPFVFRGKPSAPLTIEASLYVARQEHDRVREAAVRAFKNHQLTETVAKYQESRVQRRALKEKERKETRRGSKVKRLGKP
ncbi:hypothetical protein F4677DRAFT_465287 [Hypoxylon crocopeplum]|nr:hypothetical protein F4677DRAFT_465287 [Hypoxylon crocopeplum]